MTHTDDDKEAGTMTGSIPQVWSARHSLTVAELVAASEMSIDFITERLVEDGEGRDGFSDIEQLELLRARWYLSKVTERRSRGEGGLSVLHQPGFGPVPVEQLAETPPVEPGPIGEFEEATEFGRSKPFTDPPKDVSSKNDEFVMFSDAPATSLTNQPDHRGRRA